ncbi:aldo/keto reductase [Methylobacterium sp. Gmos1]
MRLRTDQVAIAWASTHGTVPMIGPRSLDQLRSNLGATTLELSSEHVGRLDAVSGIAPAALPRRRLQWGTAAFSHAVA